MIEKFFTTVQEDMVLVIDRISGQETKDEVANSEQDKKVALAAIRIIAAFGMVIGIITGASAIPFLATATVGALFKMTLGAAIYAIFHDLFVMSKNATDQRSAVNAVGAVAKSIFSDVVDLFTGKKDIKDAPRQPVTENTIFRPLWDAAFARVQ